MAPTAGRANRALSPALAGALWTLSALFLARVIGQVAVDYAGAMVARYVLSGQLHPDRRLWPPGSIPIVFHLVLAGHIFALSRLAGRGRLARRPISSPAPLPNTD